jgi:hypothetical protein
MRKSRFRSARNVAEDQFDSMKAQMVRPTQAFRLSHAHYPSLVHGERIRNDTPTRPWMGRPPREQVDAVAPAYASVMSLQVAAIWVAIVVIQMLVLFTFIFFAFVRTPRNMRRGEQEQENRILAAWGEFTCGVGGEWEWVDEKSERSITGRTVRPRRVVAPLGSWVAALEFRDERAIAARMRTRGPMAEMARAQYPSRKPEWQFAIAARRALISH